MAAVVHSEISLAHKIHICASRGLASLILNFDIRLRWVVSLTIWPPYPPVILPCCPLPKGLGEIHTSEKRKIAFTWRVSNGVCSLNRAVLENLLCFRLAEHSCFGCSDKIFWGLTCWLSETIWNVYRQSKEAQSNGAMFVLKRSVLTPLNSHRMQRALVAMAWGILHRGTETLWNS